MYIHTYIHTYIYKERLEKYTQYELEEKDNTGMRAHWIYLLYSYKSNVKFLMRLAQAIANSTRSHWIYVFTLTKVK
jgi:uncharacterized protein YecE (DUF72 family)